MMLAKGTNYSLNWHIREGNEKTKSHQVPGHQPPVIWKADNMPCQTENLVLYLGMWHRPTTTLSDASQSLPDFKGPFSAA